MSVWKRLVRSWKEETVLFAGNSEEILDSNLKMLQRLMGIAMLVLVFCTCISQFSTGYEQRKPAYLISTACCILLILAFRFKAVERFALVGLYCIFGIFLGLTIFLSVVVSPEVMATSVIGLFCLMPPAVLDKSWRVNVMMLLFFCAHLGFSWAMKLPKAAADDTLNGICFLIIGCMFGEYMRGIKLENYEMKRQAQIQMDLDFLTGLFNRRKMFELLEKQKGGVQRQISGFVMLDIDHFKEYNDHFGHMMGDECLRRLSAGLRDAGRRTGLDFFRYGGEEFLAFCYGGELESIAEEIRNMVYDLNIPYPGSETGRVTVSLGYAGAGQNNGRIDDQLIIMADKALYKAKSSGRNRSIAYSDGI